jgi:hypothetical protein
VTPLPTEANLSLPDKAGSIGWTPTQKEAAPGGFLHQQSKWYNKEVISNGKNDFSVSEPHNSSHFSDYSKYPKTASSSDNQLRERYKDHISHILAERAGVDYSEVSSLLSGWASSSQGDGSSIAQHAAAQAFGMKMTPQLKKLKSDWLKSEHYGYLPGTPQAADAETRFQAEVDEKIPIIKQMYEWTQSWFKERGVSHVAVFRGHGYQGHTGPQDGETISADFHPLSSWSLEEGTAAGFGGGGTEGVTVHYSIVPIENIIGTSWTGFGCLSEHEVILKPWIRTRAYKRSTYPPNPDNPATVGSKYLYKAEEGAEQEAFLAYYLDDTPENTDWIKMADPQTALNEARIFAPPDMDLMEYMREMGYQESPLYQAALREKYHIHPDEPIETS